MHFDFSMQLRKRIDEEKLLLPRSPEVPKSRWKCNQVLLKENSRMGHFSKGFLDQEQVLYLFDPIQFMSLRLSKRLFAC